MGILTGLFNRRAASVVPETTWRPSLAESLTSAAGVEVTHDRALQVVTAYACVRVLADTVGQLPLILYERAANGRRRAVGHPVYKILHDQPNAELTAFEFKQALQAALAIRGNAYAEIDWSPSGQVRGLWPLRPDRMERIERDARGDLAYYYRLPNGRGVTLPAVRVLHLRGLSGDGVIGYSPVRIARETFGLALAAQQFGAAFFQNGAKPAGVLRHPGELKPATAERLRAQWENAYSGLDNAQRVAILEDGMSYDQISFNLDDAQFLQSRQFEARQIAALFGVPAHMIGDLERATFSNIEHQSIEFVTHTIGPWIANWSERLALQLLTPAERGRYYAEFETAALLRGDTASRFQAYQVGVNNGWLSVNEIRARENLNAIPGGDQHFMPLNLGALDNGGQPAPDQPAPAPADDDQRQADRQSARRREARSTAIAGARQGQIGAHAALFDDVFGSLLRRESNDIGNQIDKLADMSEFERAAWLNSFYERFADVLFDRLLPVYAAFAATVGGAAAAEVEADAPDLGAFVRAYLAAYVARHIAKSRAEIEPRLNDGDADAARDVVDRWRETRPAAASRGELVRLANAAARTVYIAAGITLFRWVANGDTCPFCRELDGQIVGADRPFVGHGQEFKPVDADAPLKPNRNIFHPPLHAGCDCQIVAER